MRMTRAPDSAAMTAAATPAGPAPTMATSTAPALSCSADEVTMSGPLLGLDDVAFLDPRDARSHVRRPVQDHEAVEAHADAAEQPPGTLLATRGPQRPDPGGQQDRGDGLPGPGSQR